MIPQVGHAAQHLRETLSHVQLFLGFSIDYDTK